MDYKECLKKFNDITDLFINRVDKSVILGDLFEILSIEISNSFDFIQSTKRSKRHDEILSAYDKNEKESFEQMKEIIYEICFNASESGEYHDFLGDIYMMSKTSSKNAGQFFTPYSLSRLNATLAMQHDEIKRDVNGIIKINEPSCGSGGQVIAAVDFLSKQGINYVTDLFVVAQDIDRRCVHMCYVQLSLLGVPAIVKLQNTIKNEPTSDVWFTPALLMQYLRFRREMNA